MRVVATGREAGTGTGSKATTGTPNTANKHGTPAATTSRSGTTGMRIGHR
jgi:hypothetical protein